MNDVWTVLNREAAGGTLSTVYKTSSKGETVMNGFVGPTEDSWAGQTAKVFRKGDRIGEFKILKARAARFIQEDNILETEAPLEFEVRRGDILIIPNREPL